MGDPIRVLCVDDAAVASFLDREGFDIVTEPTTRDGLDRLDGSIECVVSDHDLPERDGLAFLEAIRDEHPKLPFVLFTGEGSEAIASEAISAGVTDYLRKDTDTDQYAVLADRIEGAVARRRTERERDRATSRYRRFVEGTIVGVYIVRNDCIEYVNPKLAGIFGYDRHELVGRSPLAVVAESDRDRVMNRIEARECGEIDELHYTFTGVRPDGTRIAIEAHGGRIDFGDDVAVAGVLREVNDRRRREYALRALHDATDDLVRAPTAEAVVERAVAAVEEILGFPVTVVRLYDDTAETLEPAAVTDAATETLGERPVYGRDEGGPWRAFDAGEPVIADGSRSDHATSDLPLRSALYVPIDGHGTLSIGSPRGVVEDSDVRLAQVLAASVATALDRVARETELERQNERLEEFASVVSHDLRNPLGLARGRLELASEERPSEHHDDIRWALSRMDSLVDDLLALARQGEVVDETTTVSLATIAEAAWMEVDDETAAFVHGDLGENEADPDRLQRLLGNLFRNAVEYGSTDPRPDAREDVAEHDSTDERPGSDDASPEVTVRMERLADGGFAVADDGPGIPADDRDQVFESGYTTGEGTGLGLAIAKTVAEAHGWTVSITEGDAGGARFVVRPDRRRDARHHKPDE
ncbi:two-component system sensor histidine kinase [Halobacteriales archaeon QS_7_68_65]|nr:MAG: two-component system sensor histidine kinase [Halobacteriales archaeon QS_7_68_65]